MYIDVHFGVISHLRNKPFGYFFISRLFLLGNKPIGLRGQPPEPAFVVARLRERSHAIGIGFPDGGAGLLSLLYSLNLLGSDRFEEFFLFAELKFLVNSVVAV